MWRMNYGRELPWFLAVALCAAVALYVGAFALGSGSVTGQHLAIALVALGVGLVILFIAVTYRNASLQRDLVRLARETQNVIHETRQERRIAADMAARVSVLSQEHTQQSANWTVILNEIRQNQATLSAELRELAMQRQQREVAVAAPVAAEQAELPVPPFVAEAPTPEIDVATPFSEDLVVALEPVIDLFSGKAAHYRLSYSMQTSDGLSINQEQMNHHADSAQLRPSLDLQIMREAFALLLRLRKNDQRLSILTPIGGLTLAQPEAVSRIVQLFQSEPTLSDGVVIDIPHAVLAGLSSGSLEGLAYLARAGIGLSLSQAALGGLDLATLQQLNVRFISIAATGIGAEPQQSAGIASFVQAARAMKVQVIVEGVAAMQQATQIMRVARYASGPAFAEPRRVRRNGASQSAMSVAAE
jgi:EAL domain-containing protein (putative c-di-GMP-specific phosphodiesterase class I)